MLYTSYFWTEWIGLRYKAYCQFYNITLQWFGLFLCPHIFICSGVLLSLTFMCASSLYYLFQYFMFLVWFIWCFSKKRKFLQTWDTCHMHCNWKLNLYLPKLCLLCHYKFLFIFLTKSGRKFYVDSASINGWTSSLIYTYTVFFVNTVMEGFIAKNSVRYGLLCLGHIGQFGGHGWCSQCSQKF